MFTLWVKSGFAVDINACVENAHRDLRNSSFFRILNTGLGVLLTPFICTFCGNKDKLWSSHGMITHSLLVSSKLPRFYGKPRGEGRVERGRTGRWLSLGVTVGGWVFAGNVGVGSLAVAVTPRIRCVNIGFQVERT